MIDMEKAEENLKIIRELMERPVKYSTQSGLAGIVAGIIALCGNFADMFISRACNSTEATLYNIIIWSCVFVTALIAVLFLTRLREIKQGMPSWSRIKKKLLSTILPPFLAASGLTLVIIYRSHIHDGPNQWGLVLPLWMLTYGITCWQIGEFGVLEIRILGVLFIIASLITAAFFQTEPYWTFGLTFGGLHILYGIVVWIRHGG